MLLDGGSDATLIQSDVATAAQLRVADAWSMVVRGVDGTTTPVGTVAEGVLSVGGQTLRLDGALVMDTLPEPVIVGRPGLGALNVTQAWGSGRTLVAGKEMRLEKEGGTVQVAAFSVIPKRLSRAVDPVPMRVAHPLGPVPTVKDVRACAEVLESRRLRARVNQVLASRAARCLRPSSYPQRTANFVASIVTKPDCDLEGVSCGSRRWTPEQHEFVRETVRALLDAQILRPSAAAVKSPAHIAGWGTPKPRLVTNFARLNECLVPDRYSTRSMAAELQKLARFPIIIKLDLLKAYWQIALDEESCAYTATDFGAGIGVFEFEVLPFGMRNSGAVFQRIMDMVLAPFEEWTAVFVDDVGIGAPTWDVAITRFEAVLAAFSEAGLWLGPGKVDLNSRPMRMLGHELRDGKFRPTSDVSRTLNDIQLPATRAELRSVLHQFAYFNPAVPALAGRLAQLRAVCSAGGKGQRLMWTAEMRRSFVALKEDLRRSAWIEPAVAGVPWRLYTDFSARMFGWVVCQVVAGKEAIIAIGSRATTPIQARYAAPKGELVALRMAMRSVAPLDPSRRRIEWITDSLPNVQGWGKTQSDPTMDRAMLELGDFEIVPRYVKGEDQVADYWSRFAVPTEPAGEVDFEAEWPGWALSDRKTGRVARCAAVATGRVDWAARQRTEVKLDVWRAEAGQGASPFAMDQDGVLRRQGAIVIPSTERAALLRAAHADHRGARGMIEALIGEVWWPRMRADAKRHVAACQMCTRMAPARRPKVSGRMETPLAMWHTVQLDVFTPEGAGREAIVAVDELSGYVVAHWLKSKDAASLAEQIEFGVGRARGIPRRIRADAAFDTAVVRATCQRLGIELRTAAIGVHNSTGLVERTQATLRMAMARCPRGADDDMWLARAVVRVNETFSRGRGLDPASLWAGRKVRTEVEVASGSGPEMEMEDRDAAAVTQRERVTPGKKVAEAWEQPNLVVGSRVDFCYQPAQQSKLEAIDKWYGPVVVVRRGPLDVSVMSLGRRKVVFNFLPINAVRESRIPSKWMRLPPAAASQVEKEMGLVSRAAHRMSAQAAKRAAEVARMKQQEAHGMYQEAKARSRIQEMQEKVLVAERKEKEASGKWREMEKRVREVQKEYERLEKSLVTLDGRLRKARDKAEQADRTKRGDHDHKQKASDKAAHVSRNGGVKNGHSRPPKRGDQGSDGQGVSRPMAGTSSRTVSGGGTERVNEGANPGGAARNVDAISEARLQKLRREAGSGSARIRERALKELQSFD